ncbi:ATP-dependent helicase/deoxyribonuclease subunit B [Enterococcus florum]|uniref:ATP-dependent helicase/deoxyribonuclease subunit B n=1 Tax=Enterococcus florum TaxID=2480627 RepID=A0A4P5P6R4_9ENTE|nr:PD-(D/E)XK nuclease family protein [Enterococcus florum]GCF93625.1 ATP-dependent helicase/deoxyribonuclease subunit B [Enterococcus florum]
MSLQFLIGTGHNDRQTKMIDTANEWLKADEAHKVFFIVPNYNKFEQEITLLKQMKQEEGVFSSLSAQVFSFNRLAWYFLQKEGKIPGNVLSEAGNAMILRQVLQEQREKLLIFRGETTKTGFIQQLIHFYQEMQIGNVAVEDLTKLQGKQQDQRLKLSDLQRIYREYEAALLQYQVKNEDPLLLLQENLAHRKLENVFFIVSGFARFNARELQVLNQLMTCGHLMVSLELDRGFPNDEPHPLHLFADSGKTYFQLKQLADQQKIPVRQDLKALESQNAFRQVNHFWQGKKVEPLTEQNTVSIWQHTTVADEVRHVGNEIRCLVAEKGYRYKDIQVLVREFSSYSHILPFLFEQLEIPFYLDETQMMVSHPLVEFLQSLFLLDQYHYRINDVFRLLRTELYAPESSTEQSMSIEQWREQVDQTENVCLAYNFRGSYWTKEEDWIFVDYDFEEEAFKDASDLQLLSNQVRRSVQTLVPRFFKQIKQAATGMEAAKCFYQFLQQAGVDRQLLVWRDQAVAAGELEKARNHEQTWQALMDLLDEYMLIYGNSEFIWKEFQEIFLAGLVNLSYGKIPTTIDQVKINNLELARVDQAKVTFAIGLNEQVFPSRFDDRGLLSPEEREGINAELGEGKFLPESNSSNVIREPFLAYNVFLSACDKLYLSAAATIDGEKETAISPFIRRLSQGLSIPVNMIPALSLQEGPQEHLGSLRTLLSDLILLNRLALDEGQPMLSSWRQLLHFLETTAFGELTKRVFSSLQALNIPRDLQPKTAEKLYGKNLYVSVSRIENFYNCQYKYFAQFGLGLKERTIYGLTSAAAGDFYHEALDRFFRMLTEQKMNLTSLTEEQRTMLADQVLKEIFGETKFQILSSSARMNYIRYQLSQTIQKVSWGLAQQSLRTNFKPYQTEVLFGSIAGEKGIPGIQLPLKNDGELAVRGKIDRMDQLHGEKADWLSVIDYKSSARSFTITDTYYGIAMQLITYLDVALQDMNLISGKNIKPAGAYYLHVHNPVLTDGTNIERDTLKAYKYDGLFTKDPQLFSDMDHSLQEKENSLLFPIRKDAKGQLAPAGPSKEKFYEEAEIEVLRDYNRKKIQEAGNDIVSGEIKLNPAFKDTKRIACQYCPFRSVCKFDVMLKENNYHRLEQLTKEEALKRMEEDLHDN